MDYEKIKQIRGGDKHWAKFKSELRWWNDEWTIGWDFPISTLKVTGLYKTRDKIKTKHERREEHWRQPSELLEYLKIITPMVHTASFFPKL